MNVVSNTSPLIFLAQLNKLGFLASYHVSVPRQVLQEILRGKEAGHPDYAIIEKEIGKAGFTVAETHLLPDLPRNLGEGECAAISLAVHSKVKWVLIDEARGRKIARLYGLQPRGTLGVVLEQYRTERITKSECRELIFRLVKLGYRISEDVLVALLKELE